MLDTAIPQARNTRRFSGRRTLQNAAPAFLVNDSGIPAAATGPVYPEWAMVALAPWRPGAVAPSVTTIFINSLRARPHCRSRPSTASAAAARAHKPGAPTRPPEAAGHAGEQGSWCPSWRLNGPK